MFYTDPTPALAVAVPYRNFPRGHFGSLSLEKTSCGGVELPSFRAPYPCGRVLAATVTHCRRICNVCTPVAQEPRFFVSSQWLDTESTDQSPQFWENEDAGGGEGGGRRGGGLREERLLPEPNQDSNPKPLDSVSSALGQATYTIHDKYALQ